MRRIAFTVAAFSRTVSRINLPLLQFRARPLRVGLRLRTEASPVLRLRPPQAGKQVAERTAPPPGLHFRISPAYRNIYPPYKAPWGTKRTMPAHGRPTFTMSVLRWRCGGGIYCPSPSPPGFSRSKDNRLGLLSPLRYAPFQSQTLHQRLKGGGAAPGPWPRAERKHKTQTSVFAFCAIQGGVLPPPPPHRHNGARSARPEARLPIAHSELRPTADASDTPPPGRAVPSATPSGRRTRPLRGRPGPPSPACDDGLTDCLKPELSFYRSIRQQVFFCK
jgi:hypothetical protein